MLFSLCASIPVADMTSARGGDDAVTSLQLAQLRILRCEGGQRYMFSRPLDAEGAAALLAGRSCAGPESYLASISGIKHSLRNLTSGAKRRKCVESSSNRRREPALSGDSRTSK